MTRTSCPGWLSPLSGSDLPIAGGPSIPGHKEFLVSPQRHPRPATPGNCLAPLGVGWQTQGSAHSATWDPEHRPPASQKCPHSHLAPEVSRTRGTPPAKTLRVTRYLCPFQTRMMEPTMESGPQQSDHGCLQSPGLTACHKEKTGYSGFTQGLEGPAHLRVLLTTSPGLRDGCGLTLGLPQSTVETRGRCLENHRAPPPRHSQHRRDDRVPSRSWPPGGPAPRQTQRKDAGTAVINTPPWGGLGQPPLLALSQRKPGCCALVWEPLAASAPGPDHFPGHVYLRYR